MVMNLNCWGKAAGSDWSPIFWGGGMQDKKKILAPKQTFDACFMQRAVPSQSDARVTGKHKT